MMVSSFINYYNQNQTDMQTACSGKHSPLPSARQGEHENKAGITHKIEAYLLDSVCCAPMKCEVSGRNRRNCCVVKKSNLL